MEILQWARLAIIELLRDKISEDKLEREAFLLNVINQMETIIELENAKQLFNKGSIGHRRPTITRPA